MEQVESLEETVKKKNLAKYNVKLEGELKEWVESMLNKKLDESLTFQENLKSGVILCEYVSITAASHTITRSRQSLGTAAHLLSHPYISQLISHTKNPTLAPQARLLSHKPISCHLAT